MWVRNLIFSLMILCTVCVDGAFCATARGRVSAPNQSAKTTTAARAATNVRTSPVAAKTAGRTTAQRGAKPNASVPKAPVVSARAGAMQNVVGTGTKVSGAAQNTVVGADCQNLYNACMDTFCVADNFDGGRCVCSDKYRTFNKYYNEIDDLNQQAYKLQTVGVEQIEAVVSKNPALQMESVFSEQTKRVKDALENGEIGGVLKNTAHDACVKQIPQCNDKMTIMSAMYSGQINSDCIAYENSLKKLKADAKQRLTSAERGLQEIALDSAKNANKYDLGQCTIKFKECMAGKNVCGADFTGCVNTVEQTNVRIRKTTDEEIFVIPNTTANLTISKSMHDLLNAKAVICQPVLDSCVDVADSVFNQFLREAYPQLMMAENLYESNARQNCITNVSNCFRDACRDNIDPNDKDVSYDACLTRPEMMLSFCKVQLNTCGVDSTDANTARKSEIWDYVLARLAAMKVDACTTDLKNCLVDENRCGADYSKCVGLSTEQIIRMCPYDKLTGCKNVYDKDLTTNEVYENLNNVVQGIILNIDNEMLATCQAAVDASAKRVCGENLDCGNLINLDLIGTTSLDYKICEYVVVNEDVLVSDHCHRDQSLIPDVDLGRVEYSKSGELGPVVPYTIFIDVPIYWESITVGLDGKFDGIDNYMDKLEEREIALSDVQKERLLSELNSMKNGLDNIVKSIEDDPTVSACMNGRKIDGYDFKKIARFPNITQNTRALIATKMLNRAKKNYYAKYDRYTQRSLQDYLKISERQAAIKGENFKDKHREIARQSCVSMAEMSALPKSAEPPWNGVGAIIAGVVLVVGMALLCACTYGTVLPAVPAILGMWLTPTIVGVGVPIMAGAYIGVGINDAANKHEKFDMSSVTDYTGEYKIEYWNYKEDITTVFNPTDLTCEKCTVSTKCAKTKAPMFGDQYCVEWEKESHKDCITVEF